MADEKPPAKVVQTTTLPMPPWIEQWVNLVHTIGLPWALLLAMVIGGVPFFQKIVAVQEEVSTTLTTLTVAVEKISPDLKDALPLLKTIKQQNSTILRRLPKEVNHDPERVHVQADATLTSP